MRVVVAPRRHPSSPRGRTARTSTSATRRSRRSTRSAEITSGCGERDFSRPAAPLNPSRAISIDTVPFDTRVAAILVLLYTQPLGRTLCLTIDDIDTTGPDVLLRLGGPPTPVPEPVAELLPALRDQRTDMRTATNHDARQLFPGRRACQVLTRDTMSPLIRALGVPTIPGRLAALHRLCSRPRHQSSPKPSASTTTGRSATTTPPPPAPGTATAPAATHRDRQAGNTSGSLRQLDYRTLPDSSVWPTKREEWTKGAGLLLMMASCRSHSTSLAASQRRAGNLRRPRSGRHLRWLGVGSVPSRHGFRRLTG
jgi:hypothetical protein